MSFRDWLIKMLGGQPQRQVPASIPDVRPMSTVATPENPTSMEAPNTILLSTDQNTLMIVSDGKLKKYDLATNGGINLALRSGQLVVTNKIQADSQAGPLGRDSDGISNPSIRDRLGNRSDLRIELEENAQYVLTYNRATKVLGLIGATDIIQTFDDDTPESKDDPTAACALHLFSVDGQTVNLQKRGRILNITLK